MSPRLRFFLVPFVGGLWAQLNATKFKLEMIKPSNVDTTDKTDMWCNALIVGSWITVIKLRRLMFAI